MKAIQNSLILFIALNCSFIGVSQNSFSLTRDIELSEKDSREQTITIDVNEDTAQLFIMINCKISKGSVSVKIFNPSGERKGVFDIKSEFNDGETKTNKTIGIVDGNDPEKHQEIVQGSINKTANQPEQGKWLIKIAPIASSGELEINTMQILND